MESKYSTPPERPEHYPDDVCKCGEFYGFDLQGQPDGQAHLEVHGHVFEFDRRATMANWYAEDATW